MVRFFPVYQSLELDGPHAYHEGHKATVHVDAGGASLFPSICRKLHSPLPFGIFYRHDNLDHTFAVILLEIIFVILITRIIRFILKPLKQPRIVSEILGGIFIGPSLLGQNKKFAQRVLQDNATFVVRNLGIMGFMLFVFITGVKMDISLVKKSGKKHYYTALIGVAFPMVTSSVVGLLLRNSMDKDLSRLSSIGAVASDVALPAFHVIYPILKELNLLSSEVGRMALSTSIISDAVGVSAILAFEAAKQGEGTASDALWYLCSTLILGTFVVTVVKRGMTWIIDKTPEGKPVDQSYVVAILLGVFVMGFLTDMFGIAIINGPLWLGLIILDGPPLGSTLVDKSETIIMDVIMPFTYAMLGLYTDVYSMSALGWSTLAPLFAMAVSGYVSKLIGTFVTAAIFETPFRDCLTLSLIMSLRGQMEFIIILHWLDKRIISIPGFTLMVLLTTAITAICTPLISTLYDPTRPYMVTKRRTLQHTPPNTKLRIVLCFHDQQSIAGLINLLEVSNPTLTNPFKVYVLRLIELIGRAAPVFVDHKKEEENSRYRMQDTIQNALQLYEETRGECVKIHAFTAVAPKRTMYQDICELALLNKAALIILPFSEEVHGVTEPALQGMQTVNSDVLTHAPCSVGVLVDKSSGYRNPIVGDSFRGTFHNFMLLFLGGADSREALAFADRMVGNQDVSLTVLRFLSHNYVGDDEMEKKLDDGVVTWFWVKNEANERVIYREVVVKSGEETVSAIQAVNDDSYDLWITGRKEGINQVLLEGLENWSEKLELGIIGDYVASGDFSSTASVLVIQQQVLRGHGAPVASHGNFFHGLFS
ncbi:Na_H_Exchanger domain-containing protein [Cephalotus follicularis]|uniref:Na_H_Exchanger domain-containing protein n=1 Tax=Cephalotus follicularis TaxID=3775 RepID=A0A1Q3ASP2_CEPFO|nr:Na_H_Exchanger domain-containing protein [Cephalotus follicularis]